MTNQSNFVDSSTQVVLLGTGTPNAEPDRMGSALAIVVQDQAYLVDFGPGVVRRAAAAYQQGIAALEVARLDIAFLTHLHSDHTTGLPDLIYTPWVLGRKKPLDVYGPAGLDSMTTHLLQAYSLDRQIRVCGFEPSNPAAYGAISHEIKPGICYQDDYVEILAFEVDHGVDWLALGYQFTTHDRRIVISGDTKPVPSLIDLWQGCDLLIHEAYSSVGYRQKPAQWQRYHRHMHTSSTQLAAIADQVQPECLLLTHLLLWGQTEKELLDEIAIGYSGKVICGEDLGIY